MATRISLSILARRVEPHACAIAGAAIGLLAGWFGLAAGLILGTMADMARLEARARGRIEAYLREPEPSSAPTGEALSGFSAAACLALRGEWPGVADAPARRALWDRLAAEALPPTASARREAERIADACARAAGANLPALARVLATSEAPRAKQLLADWAFSLAALGGSFSGKGLDAGSELVLRARLGDSGLGAEEILGSRARAFPGERDPWTILGLAPGAPRAELKRAYRRLSRAFHPDASPGDGGERFREVRDAYARLTASSGAR